MHHQLIFIKDLPRHMYAGFSKISTKLLMMTNLSREDGPQSQVRRSLDVMCTLLGTFFSLLMVILQFANLFFLQV